MSTLLFLYAAFAILYAASMVADWISLSPEDKALMLEPDDSVTYVMVCIGIGSLLWPVFMWFHYRAWKQRK